MEVTRKENTERLFENWSPYLKKVQEKKKNFNEVAAFNLAMVLENTRNTFSHGGGGNGLLNETTQVGDVTQNRQFYFDVIASTFPNMVSQQFVSVQPMSQNIGTISYLEYTYGSNKGTIERGEIMQSALSGHRIGTGATNYTGEIIDAEALNAPGAAGVKTGALSYLPVRPGSVIFSVDGVRLKDDGNGNIVNANSSGTPLTGSSNTINYATGAYSINLAASTTEDLFATYEYNNQWSPAQVPEMNIHIANRSITARSRKLKAVYSMDAQFDFNTQFGLDMDEVLLRAASAEILHELDTMIFNDLLVGASGVSEWYSVPSSGVSNQDHKQSFVDELIRASNSIFIATQRYGGNFIVAGVAACSVLESIGAPRFLSAGSTENGPHIAGTLDGKWKVVKNPFYDPDAYLVGYKGESPVDAGYVWAPYRPLYATQLIQTADFTTQRGFASMNGKAMVNPGAYVRGTIIHTVAP